MAEIRPFVGTRYNAHRVGDLAQVLSPPYDVISPAQRDALMARHPNNFVHLDLGRDLPGDDSYANRYLRAASLFASWRSEGVLLDDERPSLYLYSQTFALPDGRRTTRTGFFAAVKLQPLGPGGVMAHEQTFEGPKADRLALMQATHAQFSAVFALYTDPERRADEVLGHHMAAEKPWDEAADDAGVEHRLWVLNRRDVIAALREALRDKPLYIADGHHRYETALRYAEECRRVGRSAADGSATHDYVLMYLVNSENPGLVILPTHRVLHRDLAANVEEFKADIAAFFDVVPTGIDWANTDGAPAALEARLAEAGRGGRTAFLMLLPGGETTLLRMKDGVDPDAVIEEEMPRAKKVIDTTILHAHVINRCWIGNPEYELDEEECRHVRTVAEAMDLLRDRRHCVAFLLNPTPIEQVKAIAALGERMPQKSTFFYPKVISGLVVRDLHLPLG